jgi:von Willebrand factor type A domain/HEAT repeats
MKSLSRRPLAAIVAVSILLVAAPGSGAANRDDPDAASVRRDVQTRMHSRQAADRAAALRLLEDHPSVESARLIVPSAFKDRDADVRKAAYEVLLKFNDQKDVCEFLLTIMRKDSAHSGQHEAVFPLLAVLLRSKLPEVERELLDAFDTLAASTKDGLKIATTLADEFGNHDDSTSVASLDKLMKSKTFERSFGFRRAVVQALARIRQPEAVDALVDLLAHDRGEIRADIIPYLVEISGKTLGADSQAWLSWWKGNRDSFKFPAAAARAANRGAAEGVATYYGLPLYAHRLVFVLDTSGSMAGPRLDAAKRELIAAIEALPDYAEFGVVAFNSRVDAWQSKLVPATLAAKRVAARFVAAQKAEATTASYDALEAAFRFDAEAIYFLSDGAPRGGKVSAPDAIVSAICATNRTRRVSIYTIGIGPGEPGGPLDAFLDALAQKNFGSYRRVDE